MMGLVDGSQADATNRHERLQEGRRGPAKPSASVWDDHNTNMWGAPAGPQAARRHLYKAAPRPLFATVSHGGACETGALSVPLPPFWFFPALLCLLIPTPFSYPAWYLHGLASTLPLKLCRLFPGGAFVHASSWPACMHLPPRPDGG